MSRPTPSRRPGTLPWARRATVTAVVLAASLVTATVASDAAHADASASSPRPSSTTTVITVDGTDAGPLPVDVAEAAWAKNTHVRFVSGPCGGPRCISVHHTDAPYPDPTVASVGGWAQGQADGSCAASVQTWLDAYPDTRRAALEHELGHCLGLAHNTTDPRSIMAPVLSLANPPKGPDAQDRAALDALFP